MLGLTWDCLNMERGTLLVKQQLRREQQKRADSGYFFHDQTAGAVAPTLAPSVVRLYPPAKNQAERYAD
ncbi:MAG: hypothetical protein ACLT1A_02580 [Dysosmobacter sp.]